MGSKAVHRVSDRTNPATIAADLAAAAAAASAAPIDEDRAIDLAKHMLRIDRRPARPFPLEALGPLAETVDIIAGYQQQQPELVAASALATVAFIAQGNANVRQPTGRATGCSMLAFLLADSSAGKGAAESVLQAPIWLAQAKTSAAWGKALRHFRRGRSKGEAGCDDEADREPTSRDARFLTGNSTPEGFARLAREGVRCFGLFTGEGAALTGGGNMKTETRAATMASLVDIYDAGRISTVRAGTGATEAFGLRLSGCIQAPPRTVAGFMRDADLLHSGAFARFLLFAPPPQLPRVASDPTDWGAIEAVRDYQHRCKELIAQPVPFDIDAAPVLRPDDVARTLFDAAFEEFEVEARTPGGSLRAVAPIALRLTELAYRAAASLAHYAGASVIDAQTARGALAIVRHSLANWRDIIEPPRADPVALNALALYRWIVTRDDHRATLTQINRSAFPRELRPTATRDALLSRLQSVGLVRIAGQEVAALFPYPPTLRDPQH
jgi:hypothetical protein